MAANAEICIIIAAHNAAATVGRAVASALAEPEVAEVVVVDDASDDATAGAAWEVEDGSGRLRILRLACNAGPAAARNRAIAESRAPLIGILDADDFLLPGRFGSILAEDDWDFIADNVVFIPEGTSGSNPPQAMPRFMSEPSYLHLADFIEGNISRPNTHRAELGFLKPLVRRAFLDRHGLRYAEALRLGEDYELYVRAMTAGARFKVIKACGYGAVVRPDSLSGRHSAADLQRLADADVRILAGNSLDARSREALVRHEAHIRDKFRFHRFLDLKAGKGVGAALRFGLGSPANAWPIGAALLRARLKRLHRRTAYAQSPPPMPARFLMAGQLAEGEAQP